MSRARLRTWLAHSLDILDAKRSSVGVGDVPVNDRVELETDVVFCRHTLLGHHCELDLDVDDAQALAAWVDLDQTRVDRLVELAKAADQADGALSNLLEGVRARAARKLAQGARQSSNAVDKCAVKAVVDVLEAEVLRGKRPGLGYCVTGTLTSMPRHTCA